MNSLLKKLFLLTFMSISVASLQACDDGPAENFGEEVDDFADDVGDEID